MDFFENIYDVLNHCVVIVGPLGLKDIFDLTLRKKLVYIILLVQELQGNFKRI